MYDVNLSACVHGVNIESVTVARSAPAKDGPYHHGNLKQALVEAGVELAREGGPTAIGVREVARRVGVSANASYRHFAALPDLMQAVAQQGLAGLTDSMRTELAALPAPSADPAADAVLFLNATGRGYVRYALAEPGLFRTAFLAAGERKNELFGRSAVVGTGGDLPSSEIPDSGLPNREIPDADVPDADVAPYRLLQDALRAMCDAGLLRPGELELAALNAWAAVHGLAELLLGPLAGLPDQGRTQIIDTAMDFITRGVISL